MGLIKIKKGLNLPIKGIPTNEIHDAVSPKRVAILGEDFVGMKPTMLVEEGDEVKLGQIIFEDKKQPEVKYTAPGTGKVIEINRGEKRKFLSLVIELSGQDEVMFDSYSESDLDKLGKDKVKQQLINSGEWTAIRVRPFSKVADPNTTPHSIFITAMDSNPLAPSVEKILEGNEKHFQNGLKVLSRLTEGKLYLCKAPGSNIPVIDSSQLSIEEFEGPHPAGNVGTHIHFLDPVSRTKKVWYVTAQDVVAIGSLFTTGKIYTERIVALCGSQVKNPKLIRTRRGANIFEITNGELIEGENRIISGSVLSGRTATNEVGYLGRFHQQITIIREGREKEFLGWLNPGFNLFSIKNIVLSKLLPNKKFNFSTALHGGKRSIVPSGNYEAVMPMDIIPTYLLRALAVKDIEEAEFLGALELDEEDLALCTFACPSKLEYGPMLRENLTIIEKEG